MRHGTRRNGPSKDAIPEVAQVLAKRLNVDVTQLRYVQVRYYDGQQWTINTSWEQLVDGQWQELDWTEYVL